jgi:hypothetical protein
VSVTNDVGGTSALPVGRYAVRITKGWDDYETGRRLIGELLDPKDIETARKAGTTGRTPEEYVKYGADHVEKAKKAAADFNPKIVYFHGDEFERGTPKASNTQIVNGAVVTLIDVDPKKTNEQLERESHDYSLKGVKTFRGMDGEGLNATLYRGDKKVAFILDEGCGGEMRFDFYDQMHGRSAEGDLWDAFIAGEKAKCDDTKKDEFGLTERGYMDGASWVNKKVDDMQNDKRFRRLCKTSIVFQVGEKIGGPEFQSVKGLQFRAHVEKKYAGQKLRILNDEFKG